MEYEAACNLYQSLAICFYYCFPFIFNQSGFGSIYFCAKWSVLATFYFYHLLFYFSVCCWFCILVSGNKKTACRTEVVELKWPRGTAMGVWTAFIVTTSWRTVIKIWSLFHWPLAFCACTSNEYTLPHSVANNNIEPYANERVSTAHSCTGLKMVPDYIGQTWQASDFCLLHAFCIVYSMHEKW